MIENEFFFFLFPACLHVSVKCFKLQIFKLRQTLWINFFYHNITIIVFPLMILLFNIDKLVEGLRECKGSVQPRKSLRHQCLKGRQKISPCHCSSTCPTVSEVIEYFIFPGLSTWFMIFLCFDRITSAPGSRRYFNLFPCGRNEV